jgi:LysW-gamma-L-lysine carboxypeptidase
MSIDAPAEFETLLGLVERYSPTGHEGEAVSWLVDRMRRLGFESWTDDAGNAVGSMGDGTRRGILLGHIDTVPGEISPRLDGQALYGRGTVDAKGPLAVFVDAVAELGAVPGWQWVVIGATDEEGDSRGARFVLDGYQPEFVIVGEPSRWDRVTVAYKGSAWSRVTVRRPMAHSAAPHPSAPEAALEYWRALTNWTDEFNRGRQRIFDQISPSLRGWSSGDDGFDGWATLQIGARLPPEVSPESWLERLQSLDATASAEPSGFSVPAYRGDKSSSLTRALLRSIREEGGEPAFVVKTGTSDLNLVGPRWGCPAVAYGPGDSSLDHTAHEHISLVEVAQARRVLARALGHLA